VVWKNNLLVVVLVKKLIFFWFSKKMIVHYKKRKGNCKVEDGKLIWVQEASENVIKIPFSQIQSKLLFLMH
jgi:hypothetical protein